MTGCFGNRPILCPGLLGGLPITLATSSTSGTGASGELI